MASRFQYSRWDGTQVGFDLDADALLEEMTDDLLYHGDLNAALRRMMQQGFRDREGRDVSGMREMLERLRVRRREQLPPALAGRCRELQQYDWMDDAARQRFEELMEELKKQLLDSMFNQLQQGMSEMSPEQLARMKDMLAELNQMLEQRERGEEPDFAGFMERFGDFFPGNPQTLDELLEQMARSMAQMQQLLNSMTPEQRAQLQQLAQSLLEDLDLRWQVDELARNLQQAYPDLPWNQQMRMRGDDSLQFSQMAGLLDRLG